MVSSGNAAESLNKRIGTAPIRITLRSQELQWAELFYIFCRGGCWSGRNLKTASLTKTCTTLAVVLTSIVPSPRSL